MERELFDTEHSLYRNAFNIHLNQICSTKQKSVKKVAQLFLFLRPGLHIFVKLNPKLNEIHLA